MEASTDEDDDSGHHPNEVTFRSVLNNDEPSEIEWDLNEASSLKNSNEIHDKEFITVGKNGKKAKLMKPQQIIYDSSPTTEYIEVSIISKDPLPKQIGLAKILKNECIPDIMKVSYKSPFKVLIKVLSDAAAEKIMMSQTFKKNGSIIKKTSEVNVSYGIIRNIDLDIEDNSLQDMLESDYEILSAKRLCRRDKEGKWIKSESVRICFKGSILPEYVYSCGLMMKVTPFTFLVSQCSNCWRYGHIRAYCPTKKPVCPKCGGDHTICETSKYKCVNCKGEHMSMVKSKCPIFQKEKEVRDVMAKYNCAYKIALIKIRGNNKNVEPLHTSYPEKSVNNLVHRSYSDVLKESFNSDISTTDEGTRSPILTSSYIKKKLGKKLNKHTLSKVTRKESNARKIQAENFKNNTSFDKATDEDKKKEGFCYKTFLYRIKNIWTSEIDVGEKFKVIFKYIITEVKNYLLRYFTIDRLIQLIGKL